MSTIQSFIVDVIGLKSSWSAYAS